MIVKGTKTCRRWLFLDQIHFLVARPTSNSVPSKAYEHNSSTQVAAASSTLLNICGFGFRSFIFCSYCTHMLSGCLVCSADAVHISLINETNADVALVFKQLSQEHCNAWVTSVTGGNLNLSQSTPMETIRRRARNTPAEMIRIEA